MKFTKLFTASVLSTALVLAQAPTGGTRGTPPDPATMIQHRVSRLTTLLALTDAQATQATAIFTSAQTATQNILPNIAAARQSLAAAVQKNDTASIDQLAATLGTLTGQLTAINSKADAAFYALLTADQQAKFAALPHGGPGGPGGRGGPGGPGPGRPF